MTEKTKNDSISFKTVFMIFIASMSVAGVIIFAVLYFLLKPGDAPQPLYLQGNPEGVRELTEPRQVVDFTLPSTLGKDASLSDFRGQIVLVYFGYTYCPDVCVLTTAQVAQTHHLLGDDGDKITFLFVSVDPARDTPDRLAQFFIPFGVQDYSIGLQSDDVTLKRITPDYGLFYERHEDEGQNYSVDHTANLYLINAEGELDTIFAYGTKPEYMAQHIEKLLSGGN